MAGNRTPTQSWSAQTPPALQRNQEKYAESVALHSCVRYPSLIIISIAYLPHACVNCRRSVSYWNIDESGTALDDLSNLTPLLLRRSYASKKLTTLILNVFHMSGR